MSQLIFAIVFQLKTIVMKPLLPTLLFLFLGVFPSDIIAQEFKVRFSAAADSRPFTGTVVIYLSKTEQEPRHREHWALLPIVFSMDVKNVAPDKWIKISPNHQRSYPVPPNHIERGKYYAQVVFDRAETPTDRSVGHSPGNIVSQSVQIVIDDQKRQSHQLTADELIKREEFKSTTHFREVRIRSNLLSDFYGEETNLFGVVVLPDTLLENPDIKLPLIVDIQGFGGEVWYYSGEDWSIKGYPYISLRLDGNCRTGHHAFANSANNGPWGDALVTELIPEVEHQFTTSGQRFVTGHSSGGWSALWLQLQYPKIFDGCWASSPDYVSFQHFQGVDIYSAKNFFVDSLNNLTPYAKIGGWSPFMFNKYESQYEEVVRGEQLVSFEAVFSPRNENGGITPLWNRESGIIDAKVVEHWKKYDIIEFLKQHYDEIGDDLKSKILVTCGTKDNFMLDVPVRSLQKEAKQNNWDMMVKLVPGDHFTLDMSELFSNWMDFMDERIRKFTAN